MRRIRSRKLIPFIVAGQLAVATPFALAAAGATGEAGSTSPQASASVVKVDTRRAPRKKVVHRRFRPWRHPTPRQVRMAIGAEARLWHIPAASLSRRVACESRYHWWASNGQFAGVLQFGPNAFYRGLRTIKHRRVRLVIRKKRRAHDMRVVHYSDGRVARKRGRPRRQVVVAIYRGRLPRHPSLGDTWTQLRIGAQAIRGISAVHASEWSCGA
jgi:hypothetical protein